MLMFHLYYIGCVFVYLMYIYLSSEINIYLSIYLRMGIFLIRDEGNTIETSNYRFIVRKLNIRNLLHYSGVRYPVIGIYY